MSGGAALALRLAGVEHVYQPPGRVLARLVRSASTVARRALHAIDLAVPSGEIHGLVGPNGAGKTTLLKVAATLLEPTTGYVEVDGFDVGEHGVSARARMGVVLNEERGLYWRLNGRQNLELFGALAGLGRRAARERAGAALATVGLEDDSTKVFGYSSGMRGRLNLARALLAEPRLLLLDEPSRSLDPVAAAALRRTLRDVADAGTGVLLSSHRLDEVAAVCDRVTVLVGGEIVHCGDPAGQADALLTLLERAADAEPSR